MTDHEPPDASVPPPSGLVGPQSDPPDRRDPVVEGDTLVELLTRKIVGQPAALEFIAPYVQMYQAGLAPPDRPAGIFLLLGPTGTGKTRTVEVLAELLHGNPDRMLRIDCGEFQSEHEVAKFPWVASGRALSIGRSDGLTKLVVEPETGRVLGAGIVGAHAGDLIAETVLAMETASNARDVGLTIHPHPTLSETVMFAAEVADGTIVDLPQRRRR